MSFSRTMKVFPIAVTTLLLVTSTALAAKPTPSSTSTKKTKPGVVAQATPTTTPAPTPAPTDSDLKTDPKADAPKESNDPATQEARTRYNRGIELYTEGDYKLALIEFQRSYELSTNWRILYNIGEVHYQLNNYALALKTLEKYLSDGGKDVPGKRRTDVERDMEALKSRTAYLTVTTSVEGAEITIDEAPIGKAPLAPDFLTDSGTHKIVATKAGFKPAMKQVTLAGREHQAITLDLVEDKPSYATPTPEAHTSYVWVGWAGTGALAAAATVTGILGLSARSDRDKALERKDLTRSELDDQNSKVKTLSLATDILIGAAVITGGVSLYFSLKGGGKRTESNHERSRAFNPTITPRLGLGSAGLAGTF